MLSGKKILIGVTGSIAAYKSILLVRLMIIAGAEVKVILTPSANEFVSSLTLATLSKNKVLVHLADEGTWANHVMLGRWADVFLIAPTTCNTLSKMAQGACDNLLLASYFSATCPVVIAPAMDEDMWHHPATKRNVKTLEEFGNMVISVEKGELASGLSGLGRMAEPETVVTFLEEHFFRSNALAGKKALVTAGPTYESIDPVRFIGNHSTGKMGFALATELYEKGADVTLVSGPTSLDVKYKGIKVVHVTSAKEMFDVSTNVFTTSDIAVMTAAVADYTPRITSAQKIKKDTEGLELELVKTKDILQSLGAVKKESQVLVGFALETDNEEVNAKAKLTRKNADLLVLNSLNQEGAGFGLETNNVTIFDKDNSNKFETGIKSKKKIAADVVQLIIKKCNEKA
jgi:phosphopantothenoylcysteine decarboxylase/phosphopantothenate--cysteine ligase